MKLSHSALNKFVECGYAYKLHYIDKLRSLEEPSSLTFGLAIDQAFAAMLLPSDRTPEKAFELAWNKKRILTGNERFSKADLDTELLTEEELKLSVNEQSFISLKRKGELMIKALREQVMPNIEKVIAVQHRVKLENQDDSGDAFIGVIDFVVKYKGYDKPIIMDLKTSSVKYKPESVKESQQLCIYVYAAGEEFKTDLAGYVVLDKKIRKTRTKTCTKCSHTVVNNTSKTCNNDVNNKRCGAEWKTNTAFSVDVYTIVDSIHIDTEEKVLDLIDKSHDEIKRGVFVQNWDSCISPTYHRKCAYYEYCRSGSMEGLVKLGKEKEDEAR